MPNNLPVKQHQQKLTFAASNHHNMPYISAFMMKNFSGKENSEDSTKNQAAGCRLL
jgi:hypothetical protein